MRGKANDALIAAILPPARPGSFENGRTLGLLRMLSRLCTEAREELYFRPMVTEYMYVLGAALKTNFFFRTGLETLGVGF